MSIVIKISNISKILLILQMCITKPLLNLETVCINIFKDRLVKKLLAVYQDCVITYSDHLNTQCLLIIDIILANTLKFLLCDHQIAWEARVAAVEVQFGYEKNSIALYKFPIGFS